MDLNDAMHKECRYCHNMAMHHRLTASGRLYCLELKREYDKPDGPIGRVPEEFKYGGARPNPNTVPVSMLHRSPLNIGTIINEQLQYIES